jgi:hypothetical protein
MNLGDGPIVMMSETSGSRHRGVHPGETIGKFKLVSIDAKELTLGFEDRTVKKTIEELIDRSDDRGQVAGGGGPAGVGGSASTAYNPATRGVEPTPPPQQPVVAKPEPGVALTEDTRSCQSGDPSPPGTIVNGMRKVVMQTPFGPACKWEKVR